MTGGIRRVALVFVLVGAAALVTPSLAFSSVDADRGSTIATADDPSNANLGMTQLVGSIGGTNSVARITNNMDQDLGTLDVDVSINTSDLIVSDGFDNSLPAGDSTDLVLDCDRRMGTALVTINVVEASGPTVTITDPTLEFTLDYDCTGGDDGSDGPGATDPVPIEETDLRIDGDPTATRATNNQNQPRSVVNFDLENTGSEVTVTSIEVRETTTSAVKVADTGPEVTVDSQGVFDRRGGKQGISIGGGRYDFDTNATIGSGTTASFALSRFKNSNNNQVDMAGEDVEIVLHFRNRDPVVFTLENIKQG